MPGEHRSAVHELVLEWLRSARADLAIARMSENQEIAPEIIAFHAQQAVEKALKALLVQNQIEFPRTYVIGVLLTLCVESGYTFNEDTGDVVTLTRYAVGVRYPGETEPVTRQEAHFAAALADTVVQAAESQVRKTG